MPIKVAWDNQQPLTLRYTYEGAWTWDEYSPCLNQGRDLMATTDEMVCIINDMRAVTKIPPNFISKAHNVIGSRPANTGLALFLTEDKSFQVLYTLLCRLMPSVDANYILTINEAQAYRRLEKWRAEQTNDSENE